MLTLDDVRRLALAYPDTTEGDGRQFSIGVLNKGKSKGFVWQWLERIDPKKGRIPNDRVVAVSVRNLEVKEMLLSSDIPGLFTEPHYNGYPAVLVRLEEISEPELADLINEAWRCKAPPSLVKTFDAL